MVNQTLQLRKHVVVLTRWAPPMVGGPTLFYNLFSQLPATSYHIITDSRAMTSGIDPATWLDGEYVFLDDPSAAKEDIQKRFVVHANSAPTGTLSLTARVARFCLSVPVLSQLLQLAGFIQTTLRFIQAFKRIPRTEPIELLGLSDIGPSLIATYLIARWYHLPYTYYMFDLYRGNRLSVVPRFIARCMERTLFTHAKFIIVNNQGTADYYRVRYGSTVQVRILHNATFPEAYERVRKPYSVKPPFEIVFSGNIGWPQEGSVRNLLKAARLLTDLPLTISLYCQSRPATIMSMAAALPNVRLTYAPYAEMPRVQANASLLFLPLAWGTGSNDIIATATPGKFTDYLASGRLMLIHAPESAFVSTYCRKKRIGIVVDRDDATLLATTIRDFFSHPEVGQKYVKNALTEFYEYHDARKNAIKLTELLNVI